MNICLKRGTSHRIHVDVSDASGAERIPVEGDVILLGVKSVSGGDAVLIKEGTAVSDGGYDFLIAPEDTVDLTPGDYWYDVNLESGADFWPVAEGEFTLRDSTTEKGDREK